MGTEIQSGVGNYTESFKESGLNPVFFNDALLFPVLMFSLHPVISSTTTSQLHCQTSRPDAAFTLAPMVLRYR